MCSSCAGKLSAVWFIKVLFDLIQLYVKIPKYRFPMLNSITIKNKTNLKSSLIHRIKWKYKRIEILSLNLLYKWALIYLSRFKDFLRTWTNKFFLVRLTPSSCVQYCCFKQRTSFSGYNLYSPLHRDVLCLNLVEICHAFLEKIKMWKVYIRSEWQTDDGQKVIKKFTWAFSSC